MMRQNLGKLVEPEKGEGGQKRTLVRDTLYCDQFALVA